MQWGSRWKRLIWCILKTAEYGQESHFPSVNIYHLLESTENQLSGLCCLYSLVINNTGEATGYQITNTRSLFGSVTLICVSVTAPARESSSTSNGTVPAPFTGAQLSDGASPARAELNFSWAFPPVSGQIKTFSTSLGIYADLHCACPSPEPGSSFLSHQHQYNDAFHGRVPFGAVKLSWARLHHFSSLLVIINGLEMILQARRQTKGCFKGCYTWNTLLAGARLKANTL